MLHGNVNLNKLQAESKQAPVNYKEIWYYLMLFPFPCLFFCMHHTEASVSSFILKNTLC